ncbi:reverse transcriptase domain-containing protein [Tanacetum coccineum]
MEGIDINDLTIEQYFRLTSENQTPSMGKKIDAMTINKYMKYEESMKRQYSRNSGSYFPTYFGHYAPSNNTTLKIPHNTYLNPIQPNTEFDYDSEDMELDEEAGYTTDEESVTSEHKTLDPAHVDNVRSLEELSSEEDLDEWLKEEMEKHMSKQDEKNKEDALIAIIKFIREEYRAYHKNKQNNAPEADLKSSSEISEDTIKNDSSRSNLSCQPPLEELHPGSFLLPFTIDNYNSYAMANIDASNNVMPRSIYEYLKLDNPRGTAISVKINDMMQPETLGTVNNVWVKIDKFEFPCDFVVTDMPKNLGEIIILGRPFLETVHAQIDVFKEEISLEIGDNRIKFDINGNPRQSNIPIEKVYMENTSQEEESFNPLEMGYDLFSYESPACLQFEQDTRNYNTIDPHNEISRQTNPFLDKRGLTIRWHVCKPVQVSYDDESGEDCGMWPTCYPNSSFCYGYKEVFEKREQGLLKQWVSFRDHEMRTVKGSCMEFADFLQVRYGNQGIDDTTRERRYDEWFAQNYEFDNNRTPSTTTMSDKYPYNINHQTPIPLDACDTRSHSTYKGSTSNQDMPNNDPVQSSPKHLDFDVEEEYAKEIGNPYARRFDEYKRVFDNEIEHLSNEYTLRIGNKGYVLDDVWQKYHGFIGYPFDYRVTLGFGSIASGLDPVSPVIRLPIEREINSGTREEGGKGERGEMQEVMLEEGRLVQAIIGVMGHIMG